MIKKKMKGTFLDDVLMAPAVPIITCFVYLLLIFVLQKKYPPLKQRESKPSLFHDRITFLHNFLLAIESIWFTYLTFSHILNLAGRFGLMTLYCDTHNKIYDTLLHDEVTFSFN